MPARTFDPREFDDGVHVTTDMLGDHPQRYAEQLLIPQIAKQSKNALGVTPIPVEFFQRLKVGRRCSCFTVEDSPSGTCPVCWGVGIVGGYQKRGTMLSIFDVTFPNVHAVNVCPDMAAVSRPVTWALTSTAVFGYLVAVLPIKKNLGVVDTLFVKASKGVALFIQSPSDADWVPLTKANLQARLNFSQLMLQAVFQRTTPEDSMPRLSTIRIAYKTLKSSTVLANVPRFQESLTLEEFGIYESWSSQQFWMDSTVRNYTTEDWFYSTRDGLRWKVIEVQDNRPLNILTSWDLQCRLVQNFEPYAQVPVGAVIAAEHTPPQGVLSYQEEAKRLEPGSEAETLGGNVRSGADMQQTHGPPDSIDEQPLTNADPAWTQEDG